MAEELRLAMDNRGQARRREANIDLLRSICAIFVVFEHFCETSVHNAFGFTLESSIAAYVLLRLIYGIARTAVPVFFLLSGYLSVFSTKQRLGKVINLFVMTGVYQFLQGLAIFVVNHRSGESGSDLLNVICRLFPQNYYLYLFSALYCFSPYINKALTNLGRKNHFRLIVILFSLFSLWSTGINTICALTDNMDATSWYFTSRTGTSMGFNIANFTMVYIIGCYLRLYYKPNRKKDVCCACVVLICSTIITSTSKILFPTFSKAFMYYDSVFVIVSAVALTIVFLNISMKQDKIICLMGMHTYGVFLIHGFASACVEKVFSIEETVSKGLVGTLLGIVIFVLGVYILALIMTTVVELMASPINSVWKKTKLYNYQFYCVEEQNS